ncbi:MAG: DUF3173 family protein [Streptococcus hyointestinalis]|uniref:DUF3173 family protein n=1 Tax=Streptococcus hyointestinalis TaxID=1337 RepID=UPI0023F0D6C3|nr:DUF3173 family protein [Streptococcus hyointestinalis]MCI6871488.1 DUF3173 domain-containing protein [Streptococcus hyointestinalis]MDD7355739.1 DUF3173 family protein [Streptococcus hyointestinalis]MDY4554391.1 DUF3173 family protein [Streptococcus hyointestinalis]
MIAIVDKNDLMALTGYSQSQCAKLIRTAKIKLVADGFSWYKNKRVGRVPLKTIEDILGFSLTQENDIMYNVLQNAGLHDIGEQQ